MAIRGLNSSKSLLNDRIKGFGSGNGDRKRLGRKYLYKKLKSMQPMTACGRILDYRRFCLTTEFRVRYMQAYVDNTINALLSVQK